MIKIKLIRFTIIPVVMIIISLTNCSKSSKDVNSDTTTLQQLAKDQTDVESASEDGLNDANNVVSPGLSKTRWIPLNATLDTVIAGDTTIYTITYNGVNAYSTRSRTGEIIIKRSTATPWALQGATITVTFVNYKVTKLSTGKSITLNGTKTYINVSGGLVYNLGQGITQIIHQASGALKITFDDSTVRVWNITRRRTFSGTWSQLVLSSTGFGNSGGYSNLESYGTNRNGELFYTQINQPVVRNLISCGLEPVSGIINHQIPSDNKSATITFGFDVNNQPVSGSGSACPVKYKLDWVKNGISGTLFVLL